MTADVQRDLAAPQTTAGTAGANYKVEQPPIPRPRHGDDPREPGRRNTNQRGGKR